MNRIKRLFLNSSEKVMPYITAGYPHLDSTVDLALSAAKAGADMIEIGIPFYDPQADGPIIQKAREVALDNGITMEIIFRQLKEIRLKSEIPIALMGYYNPILKMGHDSFLKNCSESDIDGLILPDLPFDEVKPFCSEIKKSNISPILLVAPNTPPTRIQEISELAGELIYAVSILGITGNKLSSKDKLRDYLKQVRLNSKTPFVVGFGISSRKDVKWFNKYSDGAVVGSAIIKKFDIKKNNNKSCENYIKMLKGMG